MWAVIARNLSVLVLGFGALYLTGAESPVVAGLASATLMIVAGALMLAAYTRKEGEERIF